MKEIANKIEFSLLQNKNLFIFLERYVKRRIRQKGIIEEKITDCKKNQKTI